MKYQFKVMISFASLVGIMSMSPVQARMVDELTDSSGYTGPSVEENCIAMDTDKNGFVDVFEVRAFLELKNGKGYKRDLLDRLEANAQSKSCGTTTTFLEEYIVE